jgi:MFS family permease
MTLAGLGYGTFLTVFPAVVGDAFHPKQFGLIMSSLQLGVAVLCVLLPPGSSAFAQAAGGYTWPHATMAAVLLLAAIVLGAAPPRSPSFVLARIRHHNLETTALESLN